MNDTNSSILAAVSVLITIATAFATFRFAQLVPAPGFTEAIRRPRPAESQQPTPKQGSKSGRRSPWIRLSVAIVAFWLALVVLQPLRFVPVRNPTAKGYLGTIAVNLEVDIKGRRLEEGDAFTVRLTLVDSGSSNNHCLLSKTNVSTSLAVAAAEVVQVRSIRRRGADCELDAEWIVAPMHAGRQIVAVTLALQSYAMPSVLTLETDVAVDRSFDRGVLVNGLVPILVALFGLLTKNRKDDRR